MKNAIIFILICVILALGFTLIISKCEANKPDEMIVQKAVVDIVEDEGEGHYRYEIITEDGNQWVVCGDGSEARGDHLVVVFYTFNSTDKTTWDILEYWKCNGD